VIQPEPINARFVGGPLDGETHLMAHRLPFVEVPGPDEQFFARLHLERPAAPDHLLYELQGADDPETLVYRCLAAADADAAPAVAFSPEDVTPEDPGAAVPPGAVPPGAVAPGAVASGGGVPAAGDAPERDGAST
jgi:hypothetical protein